MTRPALKVRRIRFTGRGRRKAPTQPLSGGRCPPRLNHGSDSSYLRFSLLKAQLQHCRAKLTNLAAINRALAECTTLPEVYDRLSKSVMATFPQADALYIFQVDPHNDGIRFIHSAHAPAATRPLVRDVLPAILPSLSPNGLQSEVVRTARPLLINDLRRYATRLNTTFPEMAGNSPVKSLLLSPMIARRQVQGILELLSHARDRFTEEDSRLLSSIGSVAALAIQNQYLKDDVDQAGRELAKTYESTIEAWRRALELRDQVTEGHTSRVAEMTVRLGAWLGVDRHELVFLRFGAVLHDIGKIGIPDSVLLKPGPLEGSELGIMRKHPEFAFEMLSGMPNFGPVLEIPYYHHERWDGTGYPKGLEREQIPLSARIFAVIDVWDALCSDRPYRQAWPEQQAVTYIQDQSGKHFDPHVVEAFLALVITSKYQN